MDVNNVHAILRYAGAPEAEPTTVSIAAGGVALVEANLVPVNNPGITGDTTPNKVFK